MSTPAGPNRTVLDSAIRNRTMWYLVPLVIFAFAGSVAVAVLSPAPEGDAGRSGPSEPVNCAATAPTAGLRALATRCGLDVGTAVSSPMFTDTAYRETVAREYNSITPESALKWGTVEARPGQFTFAPGDAFIEVAERNKQRVRGHTLVWHKLPAWVTDGGFTPEQLRGVLRRHIETTVTHWRGRLDSWDVVNEPLNGDGTLRDSVWLRGLGAGYIAESFRWARAADPDAKLYLNDFGVEGVNRKSDALYRLVRDLRAEGVPIDGVGFQTHVFDVRLPDTLEENLRRFAALGVEIAMTEVDVRLPLPATPDLLQTQATLYARALHACVELPACRSFTSWGFTDLHSWGDREFPDQGAALPFDKAYQPKPAYWAMRDTLAAAVPRPVPRRRTTPAARGARRQQSKVAAEQGGSGARWQRIG